MPSDESGRAIGRCDTDGCYRDAAMTYRFTDGEGQRVERDLCLPCRRVIELARRIPWNDEADEWHDPDAHRDFLEGDNGA